MDIVLAEGFKQAEGVDKIEVRRDAAAPRLSEQVAGVVATVTDLPGADGLVFGLDDIVALVDWIEARRASEPENRHG